MVRVPKRDLLATALVAAAIVVYVFWAIGSSLPGLASTRATGTVVLGLGFAASAGAVVPGFETLIRGSRVYLAVTMLIGLVAFGAGAWMLLDGSDLALGALMGAMGLLWLIATIHHVLLSATAGGPVPRATPGNPRSAGIA
jgi:hypothetical protein